MHVYLFENPDINDEADPRRDEIPSSNNMDDDHLWQDTRQSIRNVQTLPDGNVNNKSRLLKSTLTASASQDSTFSAEYIEEEAILGHSKNKYQRDLQSPTTTKPTLKPTTSKPTTKPTTSNPTTTPTTSNPTKNPTTWLLGARAA